MMRKSGQSGVPVIEIGGQIVVGFDRNRLQSIIASQSARRPSLGARIADARAVAAKMQGVPAIDGAYVGAVRPGSTAERAGLRTGDVIVAMNDRPIRGAADVERLLSSLPANVPARLRIMRNGQESNLVTTL